MIRWRVVVDGEDLSCTGLSGSVSWGRDDLDSQPDASTASVTFDDRFGTIANGCEIGQTLDVIAAVSGIADVRRFSGTLVDVVTDHEARRTTLTAAGELARLSRVRVGDVPWPAESEGDRILRVLELSDVETADATRWVDVDPALLWRWTPDSWTNVAYESPTLAWSATPGSWADADDLEAGMYPDAATVAGSWRELRGPSVPPGGLVVRARDVDSQPATAIMRDVAESCHGVLYERRDGTIAYAPRTARTRDVDVDTSACEYLSATTFARTSEGLVNRLEVVYGDEPADDSGRPTFTVSSDGSLSTFGRYAQRWETDLEVEADARLLAELYLHRRASPRWRVETLRFDSEVATADATAALMAAELGDTLRVAGISAPTPAGTMLLIVEGATETIDPGSWLVDFRCSDARLSMLGGSWAEHGTLDPSRLWSTVPAGLPWNDADDLLPAQ